MAESLESFKSYIGKSESATLKFKSACTPNIVEMPNARLTVSVCSTW